MRSWVLRFLFAKKFLNVRGKEHTFMNSEDFLTARTVKVKPLPLKRFVIRIRTKMNIFLFHGHVK